MATPIIAPPSVIHYNRFFHWAANNVTYNRILKAALEN